MKIKLKIKLIDDKTIWALGYLRKYIIPLVGILLLGFAQSYAFANLPKVSTNFIFQLFTPERIHELTKFFLIALGIIVLKSTLSFVTNYSSTIIIQSAINNLRCNFFNHLINLPIHFFKKNKVGNFITLIINDTTNLKGGLYENILVFINKIVFTIIIIVKLSLLNYKLTLISLTILPLLYFVFKRITNKTREISKKLQQNTVDLSSNVYEIVNAIEIIKAFAREDYEKSRFKQISDNFKKTNLKLSKLKTLISPLNETVTYFFGILLIGIGGFFIVKGQWTVKGLTEYLMLLGLLASSISPIPSIISGFKVASASIERLFNIIQIKNDIKDPPNPVVKSIEGNIEFSHVYFSYKKGDPILKNINFTVNNGEIVALVGSSGVGKTTISNLIPRFYDVDSGEIKIDGINVKNYSLKCLRSQIGIVSQNVILFNDTIYNNIRYPKPDAKEEEIIESAKKAYAYDFIMNLPDKFNTIVEEKGSRLSGGEKQRISIARTILINPQILILDEATSSLDSESEYYIQLAINELMKGKTSIVIAHRLSTIKHANKIIVLDKGQIIDIGDHEYLIKHNEIYKKFYDLQYFR